MFQLRVPMTKLIDDTLAVQHTYSSQVQVLTHLLCSGPLGIKETPAALLVASNTTLSSFLLLSCVISPSSLC